MGGKKGRSIKMNKQNFESSMRDWSSSERQKFLRSIPAPKVHNGVFVVPGLSARGICGCDVSVIDRRSVKAQLAGRGDFRAAWWEFYQKLHAFLHPSEVLEHAMYAFHKRHHTVTLALATIGHDFRLVFHAVLDGGVFTGVKVVTSDARRQAKDGS
jgi:hypothetical protein